MTTANGPEAAGPEAAGAGTPEAGAAGVAAALRRLAGIGPFFAAEVVGTAPVGAGGAETGSAAGSAAAGAAAVAATAVGPRPAEPAGTGDTAGPDALVGLDELYRGGAPLAAMIDAVGDRLGGVERRIAASVLSLGHAARLWSVALGCWATSGVVPDLDPGRMRIHPVPQQPVRLVLVDPAGRRAPAGQAAPLLLRAVARGHLAPYFAALRAQARLPAGLLWGNAASALVGSARMLLAGPPGPGDRHPAVAADAVLRVAAELLASPPLAGTTAHAVARDGRLALSSVVRRSCCLYYRIPGGGFCGDCPLSRRRRARRRLGG